MVGREVKFSLDLKNNHITVGELLDNPKSRAVFQRRFPMVLKHPMMGAARTVTLEQLMAFAGAYLPKNMIHDTLQELQKV